MLGNVFIEHSDTQPLLNANELMELKPGESVVVRVTKRTDLKGRNITPNPIFNHGKTALKYSYQYLSEDFPDVSFQQLKLADTCAHRETGITDILYSPIIKVEDALVETALPFERPLNKRLTEGQMDLILKFFRAEDFDDSTIDFSMTMTQFDSLLQDMYDQKQISQSTFDDIYTILKDAK